MVFGDETNSAVELKHIFGETCQNGLDIQFASTVLSVKFSKQIIKI